MNAAARETAKQAAGRLSAGAKRDGYSPEALHKYTDAKGGPLYWRVRLKHPTTGDKWIRPMRFTGSIFEVGEPPAPASGKPLYRLHDLAQAPMDAPVFVVEGEWCADKLAGLGLNVTTSGSGASAEGADWTPLAGRSVVLWPDFDKPGIAYADAVRARLEVLGCACMAIDVAALGLPEKGDAVDWLRMKPEATAHDVLGLQCLPSSPSEPRAAHLHTALADDAPKPLPSSLLPVEPLPLEALPGAFGDWISDVAERSNCPPDYVALPLLVGAGMLLARHCGLRPKRLDTWTALPNIWGCIVGPPGAMKSPAMKEGLFALERMEQAARKKFLEARDAFKVEAAAAKLRNDEGEKSARKILGKDRSADVRHLLDADDSEAAPVEIRHLVTDATVEMLGVILAANPGGVVYARDELGSLFKTLAREEQAPARGFMLTAWDGGRYRFDRITRGSVDIPNARVALVGSIQPGPLSEMVRAAHGSGDDGLLQRPLYVWPDGDGEKWQDCDRYPNGQARNAVLAMFDRLHHAPPAGCQQETFSDGAPDGLPFLRLDDGALELFLEWRGNLEATTRDPETADSLKAALSKYRKHTPALALIVHALDGGNGAVTHGAMLKALALSEYFESHTRRVFDSGRRPIIEAANAILRRLKRSDLPADGFTLRDVQRPQWSGLTDRATVAEAAALLCDYRHLDAERVDTGGRPSELYVWRTPA